jgi:hypothetical protein
MSFEDNPADNENHERDLMLNEIQELKQKHAALVTAVAVTCACLSAPLFLDQEGRSDVHDAARAALKYLREAVANDQGRTT